MFVKTINGFLATTLITFLFATTAQAKPHGKNLVAETIQMAELEQAYKEILSKKAKTPAKPKLVKATFSPDNSKKTYSKSLRVTATAYTSHVGQTDSTPNIAAWGDRLHPGMKAIAVSRDLLKEYGLKRGQKVRIKGLGGEYAVLDKMNKRWRKKIDIYMGMNKRKAFKWGRRKVEIRWN